MILRLRAEEPIAPPHPTLLRLATCTQRRPAGMTDGGTALSNQNRQWLLEESYKDVIKRINLVVHQEEGSFLS